MKRIATLCLTYAITLQTAMAFPPQGPHGHGRNDNESSINCMPYAANVKAAQDAVNGYQGEHNALAQALAAAEANVRAKESTLAQAQAEVNRASVNANALRNEIASHEATLANNRVPRANLSTRKVVLENEIANLQLELDSLRNPVRRPVTRPRPRTNSGTVTVRSGSLVRPGGGRVVRPRPGAPQARIRSLEAAISTKRVELARVNSQLASIDNAMQVARSRMPQARNELVRAEREVVVAQRSYNAVASSRPLLADLKNAEVVASRNLARFGQTQGGRLNALNKALAEANENLLMCKTYTVKYPAALEAAQEISRVGCNRYHMPREAEGRPFMKDAINEIFKAICNR